MKPNTQDVVGLSQKTLFVGGAHGRRAQKLLSFTWLTLFFLDLIVLEFAEKVHFVFGFIVR